MGGLDLIYQAQNREKWRAFLNTVTNLLVPLNMGYFLTSWETLLHGVKVNWFRALQHGDRMTTDFQLWQVVLKVANKDPLHYHLVGPVAQSV